MTTLADSVADVLADMQRVARLRPHPLHAYRYEVTAAAAAITQPLAQITHRHAPSVLRYCDHLAQVAFVGCVGQGKCAGSSP